MEEQYGMNQSALLNQLLGGNGGDTLGMMERMSRLSKLVGNNNGGNQLFGKNLPDEDISEENFSSRQNTGEQKQSLLGIEKSQSENILFAILPFFDGGQQKNIYMLSKVMELQRVMGKTNDGGVIYAREKEANPVLRRNKMMEAVKPFLPERDRQQLDTILRMMQMKDLLGMRGDN